MGTSEFDAGGNPAMDFMKREKLNLGMPVKSSDCIIVELTTEKSSSYYWFIKEVLKHARNGSEPHYLIILHFVCCVAF